MNPKTLIIFAVYLFPALSLGQTFPVNNIQVNGNLIGASGTSPVNMTTGAVLSTVFTATGLVTTSDLATQTANTILANGTGSAASPTALSVPSCSTSSNALTWTSGSGFACNSAINSSTLGGIASSSYALLASPTFTGTPSGPTASAGTNTGQLATTSFVQTATANPVSPSFIGSGVAPNLTLPINTTAATNIGSAVISVTNSTGITAGMGIYGSFVGTCSSPLAAFSQPYVVSISTNIITMSCNATATNSTPVAVQFGQTRFNSASTIFTNYVGDAYLKVGQASYGNTTGWLDQVSTGQDFPTVSTTQILTNRGDGYAMTIGARTSDANGNLPAFPFQSFFYADTWGNTSYNGENVYLQDNLAAATAGHSAPHIQMEQSMNTLWGAPPAEDPFTINVVNQTVSHRYDCGTGQASTSGMNGCTTAIDMVTNPENFQNGIVFGNNAISVNGGFGNAISFPTSVGLIWYSAASTFSGQVYSSSAGVMTYNVPTGGQHQFNVNGVNQFSVGNGFTFQKAVTFATVSGITCNSANEGISASITDSTTATFGATVTGGGTNHIAARCNGSNWVVY